MPETPLVEADPKSIDDLFNEDPLELTNDDLNVMVKHYRENRALWAKEESASQAEGRKRRPKEYKAKPLKGLTLADIGMGKKDDEAN